MFGLFKSAEEKERDKLQKRYEALMKEAQSLQRGGDIPAFAKKTAEANAVLEQIDALDAKRQSA